ncbi:pinin-like [Ptychodera flava]|uniref:pinin-like n=1 Tax=Ptychodera flava TaxID=63121 RepID=UPI003969F7AC
MAVETHGSVADLQQKLEKAKESLQSVDENIKKLTGRDPTERRPSIGDQRRVSLGGQSFRGRGADVRLIRRDSYDGPGGGGPPPKRMRGSAFSRLGGRVGSERGGRRRDSDDDDEDAFDRKPGLQSSVVATPKDTRTRKDSIAEASADKKGMQRNRRMFGLLMGTLQKFKADATQKTQKDKRRHDIENKLEEQAQREKKAVAMERIELFQERKSKQKELNKLQRLMELAQMQEEWDAHNRNLCNFIRTKSKPHIFYKPAKMSSTANKYHKESKEIIEEIMKKRRAETEIEIKREEKEIELQREERRKLEEAEKESKDKEEEEEKGKTRHGSQGNEIEMDDLAEENTIEFIEPQVAMETETEPAEKEEKREEDGDNDVGKEGKGVELEEGQIKIEPPVGETWGEDEGGEKDGEVKEGAPADQEVCENKLEKEESASVEDE